ncbi:hypothetical protein PG623_00130 [Riemerella anatipestifer]|nr:hypothetical protein [Riemerella anatipestifer]
MSELINTIFIFFTDKTKKITHKTFLILTVIIGLIFLDNTLSFTFTFNNKNKLEQVEKLNSILKDSTLSKQEIAKLGLLRTNIIEHKTWKDNIYEKLLSLDFKSTEDGNKPIVKNDKHKVSIERNYWLHFISSSWIFTILMIIMPFIGLFSEKNGSISAFIVVILMIEPLFFGMSWLFAKLFSYIPIIDNNPVWNYLLNTLLHLFIFMIIGFLINRNEKKKKLQIT